MRRSNSVEALLLVEELLGEVRKHCVLPNYPYPFFGEIFSEEVAWPYSYLPVAEPSVRLVHDVGYPEQRRVRLLEPAAKQAFDRWLVGEERGEVESPAQGGVDAARWSGRPCSSCR